MQLEIDKDTVKDNLVAALVNIPQSVAHALLATVNSIFARYTLMVTTPVGALFTSSMFRNVSTTSALAVASGDPLITYRESNQAPIVVTLVVLVGAFQLLPGIYRQDLGTRIIPYSVMTGFMTGVAILIIIGQLGDFTGYYSGYLGKVLQVVA
jgi:sulfate permease, SulP family